jgi:hypothetical protein
MDRKLARKNIRSGLIPDVRDHVPGGCDLRPPVSDVEREAPPAGEEVHLPGPTILPFATAVAITLIVIGSTIDWIFSAIGGVVFVVCAVRWIQDSRRNVAELPEEHH